MARLLLLALCPLALCMPVDNANELALSYDEDQVRNVFLPLAASAYSSSPSPCIQKIVNGQLTRQVTVKCDGFKDTCSGYTAVAEAQKTIILAFRGTTQFDQLVDEITSSLFNSKLKFVGGGEVNKYFFNAFLAVYNGGLKDELATLKQKYPCYKLWITGHSLGGSMASAAAGYIAGTGAYDAQSIQLVTFGEPRTGDSDYAKAQDNTLKNAIRVTHFHDIVPHVPLEIMGFKHHLSEVYYPDNMKKGAKYIICDQTEDDKKCSDRNIADTSIADHLFYFDQAILDICK